MSMENVTIIFRRVEEMMQYGHLSELNDRLREIDVDATDTDLLLAWLTAILPVRYQLPARLELFAETKRVMIERGDFEPGILDGLE